MYIGYIKLVICCLVLIPASAIGALYESKWFNLSIDASYYQVNAGIDLLNYQTPDTIDTPNPHFELGGKIEHVFYLLPDIAFRSLKYTANDHKQTLAPLSYIDYLQQDLLLFYQYNLPIPLVVRSSLGLNIRKIHTTSSTSKSIKSDTPNSIFKTSPVLTLANVYIESSMNLPINNLTASLYLHSNFNSHPEASLNEIKLFMNYRFAFDTDVQLGIINSQLVIEETKSYNKYRTTINNNGIYLKVIWRIVNTPYLTSSIKKRENKLSNTKKQLSQQPDSSTYYYR